MDLIKLKIPAAFILPRVTMSWREMQFGLENELLDQDALLDLAVEYATRLSHPPIELQELSDLSRNDLIRSLVDHLASKQTEYDEAEARDKWLFLVLAWLYERRNTLTDALQVVEEVYADFGYPEEISDFVRYMPMKGPDLGSREANEQRLVERWADYLCSTASRYSPEPRSERKPVGKLGSGLAK